MKTPRQFYTKLKVEGLASRKKKIRTQKELAYLVKLFDKKDKILDLACGYGRFTIPLAKKGYNIEGIDITPIFIARARKDAKKEKLLIKFTLGDIRKLPYKDDSFNKIICMWSAFIELNNRKDQLKAIKEMNRVLIKGGFVFIDMSVPLKLSKRLNLKRNDVKPQKVYGRVIVSVIDGVLANGMYMHDKSTLTSLMKESKIKKFKIFKDNFGGRERFFLQFWKSG